MKTYSLAVEPRCSRILFRPSQWVRLLLALIFAAGVSHAESPADEGVVLVPVSKVPKEAPLFYSAEASVRARVDLDSVASTQEIRFKIHQGKADLLTLSLSGQGEVANVTGEGLRDWSVRVAPDGGRFLDIRPVQGEEKRPEAFNVTVATHRKVENGLASLLLPGPGPAAGFTLSVVMETENGAEVRPTVVNGLVPVDGSKGKKFVGSSVAELAFAVSPDGMKAKGLELLDTSVKATLSPGGDSMLFGLTGVAKADAVGATLDLFSGGAALSGGVSGDGWHVVSGEDDKYHLHADRAGEFPVALDFVVPVTRIGDWRSIGFHLSAGVVVPLDLAGLEDDAVFDRTKSVVPGKVGELWRGYLPVDGAAAFAWKPSDSIADGTLFFSSTATSDIRVGSGLLRQLTTLDFRVLQGKLPELALALKGPGEVLSVTGNSVLAWSVKDEGGARRLDIKLNRAIEGAGRIVVESQAAIGAFPVQTEVLTITPDGALRHSGSLRVASEGAVSVEVADTNGLIQLSPEQFPGSVDESLRQVFVYRFPSAGYDYVIRANQVLPEVSVTEVTVHELGESDRMIRSDMELDIREAPLREWDMEIPADHAVASVTGSEIADYSLLGDSGNGMRKLRVIFRQPVMNRQLFSLRLEKNEAAKAGAWELPEFKFPAAKSHRGYVGAVAAAGYRLVSAGAEGVAEVPVSFFPAKVRGLQQAFRLKEPEWRISMAVEAIGQSVQADVFHLYSLKSGAVYGSVLINYFVIGAPATEWKIAVPAGIGNIDVTGQNVGRDWRREDDVVIVPLVRPVSGAGTVLLTFEQPMNARGGELRPGEVRPMDVQTERGYIQVVSPLQVKTGKPSGEGPLLEIDPGELPAEFRLLSTAPTLAAWQYTARDFKIAMTVDWYEPGETVAQVVDFMKLSSKIAKDGEWVTDVRFFVKSRSSGSLRLALPANSTLWEAKVNGEPVNARKDGADTLVPIETSQDPNQAMEVSLRYGDRSPNPRAPKLLAPILSSPVVLGEWLVSGDEGMQLVPRGGDAGLARPVLAVSGWRWLNGNPGIAMVLLILGATAVIFGGNSSSILRRVMALSFGLAFVACASLLSIQQLQNSAGHARVLEYAVPVVAAGAEVALNIGNVSPVRAATGWGVWGLLLAGTLMVGFGVFRRSRVSTVLGMAIFAAGLLSIHGGVPVFSIVAALVGFVWCLPRAYGLIRLVPLRRAVAPALPLVLIACLMPWNLQAEQTSGVKPMESLVQDWRIQDGRVLGTLDLTIRADAGERFLLLRAPAVLKEFEGEGLRVQKAPLGENEAYWVVAESGGLFTGKVSFEMPLPDVTRGWQLPTGPATLRKLSLRWNQKGWELSSPQAAKVSLPENLAEEESGTMMTFGLADPVTIVARAKQRDVSSETTEFFAEVSNLYLPGPGVVNGLHRVSVRPARGRVSGLLMKVPDGFTVSDVADGPAGPWRFDPQTRELRVPVEPAQEQAFEMVVHTQRGADALPFDMRLAPLRVDGAAGEIGSLALAFGEDTQLESITPEGLSKLNPEDFDHRLVPVDAEGKPRVLLQHAFRYGQQEAGAQVRISEVAPELRAESWQLVSLGDDRLVVSLDLQVDITRSGIFRLVLDIPGNLEMETATGEGLNHWTESKGDGKKQVTLHLTGKTIGKREFNLVMTGASPGTGPDWQVPRITVNGASRETGFLTVLPDREFQIRPGTRKNVSQVDDRELGDDSGSQMKAAQAAAKPGSLSYRLLQSDWQLGMSISRLNPWVTARVYQDVVLREGQVVNKAVISYRIENAAVKTLRLRIPGLGEPEAGTVRAHGPDVADFVRVDASEDLWEVRFLRGIAGDTTVELEYQRIGKEAGEELVRAITLEDADRVTGFVGVRAGGRMEVAAGDLPKGWEQTDWAVVQSNMGKSAGEIPPALSFRVADPEAPLPVSLKRHGLAELKKVRVEKGDLVSLLSSSGSAITAVELHMRVAEKGRLRLTLPEDARLFNVVVNNEGTALVREGSDWLFHVFPSPEAGSPAIVKLVYSSAGGKGRKLESPLLDVPMENLTWQVLVPDGWKLAKHQGDFDLKQKSEWGSFHMEDYQTFISSRKREGSLGAAAMLDQASAWMAQGDQEKAGIALSNAVSSNLLDAASGEDARVQLRQLKTQQAVLGLNTRRQRLLLDNRAGVEEGNGQFEKAAGMNPVLRGAYNYDPRQFERFMEGNTADENAALKEIASRIVSQQLAAEPAPVRLDVTIPQRGTVLVFGRGVQVDGRRPMVLDIDLEREGEGIAWVALPLCLLVGFMGTRRDRKAA